MEALDVEDKYVAPVQNDVNLEEEAKEADQAKKLEAMFA